MSELALVGVLLGWLVGTVLMWRLRTPPPADLCGQALTATTSVIVPARDEEATLPRLLASLAAQEHRALEVIVVDDGSTDATARVAAACGATVLDAGEPSVGWLGKPWACEQGVRAAVGARLVFLDADTWLAPDGLARIVGAQARLAADGLLSVQPYHRVERAYEHLSALGNLVPVLASGMAALGAARRSGGSRSVAFGPCLVTTRAALASVGGFDGVRGSVVEDVALAGAYGKVGRPVRCLGGGPSVEFRMYANGVRSLVEGWTKNLAQGATRAPLLPTIGAVAWVAMLATVATDGLGAVAVWVLGGAPPSTALVIAWAAVSAQLAWMLRRIGSFRWWCSVALPVPLAAFVALFLRSLYLRLLHRPVSWRGRQIDVRSRAA